MGDKPNHSTTTEPATTTGVYPPPVVRVHETADGYLIYREGIERPQSFTRHEYEQDNPSLTIEQLDDGERFPRPRHMLRSDIEAISVYRAEIWWEHTYQTHVAPKAPHQTDEELLDDLAYAEEHDLANLAQGARDALIERGVSPARIHIKGEYPGWLSLNGKHPLTLYNRRTGAAYAGNAPTEHRKILTELKLDELTPQPAKALTVEDMADLLRGGLDTETGYGIVLPAAGEDGLIWARRKMGKSRFLRWVATHHLDEGGRVTILYGEDPKGWASWAYTNHREHVPTGTLRLIPTSHIPDRQESSCSDGPPKGGSHHLAISDHLVIVDPASRFISLDDGGENLKANVSRLWRQLSETYPDAIRLVAHHGNKAGEQSGTEEWVNTPSVVWVMRYEEDGDGKVLHHDHRRHGPEPDPIRYATTGWGIRLGGDYQSPVERRRADVIAAVRLIQDDGRDPTHQRAPVPTVTETHPSGTPHTGGVRCSRALPGSTKQARCLRTTRQSRHAHMTTPPTRRDPDHHSTTTPGHRREGHEATHTPTTRAPTLTHLHGRTPTWTYSRSSTTPPTPTAASPSPTPT